MTLAEKTLWYSLKAKQLSGYKFRRQHGINEYVVDFYCPELRLAIEADGESHESEEARRYDLRRQREIEKQGIRFLRFTDDEILGNADLVVQRIEQEVMRLSKLKVPCSNDRLHGTCDTTTPARTTDISPKSVRSGGP